ncbi:MAG TPA: hypothetical protein VFW45_15510 [Candidatus Polarisedimenticolia bacterium]|nr:hypothetical protein [Candidatus Polarisedimenticolia bacterium]
MFKKMCSDCALETSFQSPGVPPRTKPAQVGEAVTSRHRFIQSLASTLGAHVKTSCRVSINVNGKTASFDLGDGITDSLVRQVADQTKLSLEEARALLQAQGSPERLMEVGKKIAESHHLGLVKCPACAQDVPPGKFCSQCGRSLA